MIVATVFDDNYFLESRTCIASIARNGGDPFEINLGSAGNSRDRSSCFTLDEIETEYPELLDVKSRSWRSYVITMRPFILELLVNVFGLAVLVDSDVVFYSNVNELEKEIGDRSFMVARSGMEEIPFNDGVLVARESDRLTEFLTWWKEKCLDWCSWTPSGYRYGAEGYLRVFNDEPEKFDCVKKTDHPGINASFWNIRGKNVGYGEDGLTIDGRPFVCFHHWHNMSFTVGTN